MIGSNFRSVLCAYNVLVMAKKELSCFCCRSQLREWILVVDQACFVISNQAALFQDGIDDDRTRKGDACGEESILCLIAFFFAIF